MLTEGVQALCDSQGPKSAEEIEKEQEAKLKAKYNNIGAKKKLMPKVSVSPKQHIVRRISKLSFQHGIAGSQIF